jgi:hypothetical protein
MLCCRIVSFFLLGTFVQARKNMCVPSTFKTHVHLITVLTVSLSIPRRAKNFPAAVMI